MPLDARVEAAKLRELYMEDPLQSKFSLLLTGDIGTGKSSLIRTARKPIHIDSFDPGGTKVLSDLIIKGDIVADTAYERELPAKPSMFKRWKTNFEMRVISKYFDNFGTYCLDSSSQWAEAIMNQVLSDAGIAGKAPRWTQDYTPQKNEIKNWTRQILQLPCDIIVTGHLDPIKENKIIRIGKEAEEREIVVGYRYLTTGNGKTLIPSLFGELWVTMIDETSGGMKYTVLTRNKGLYQARTRMGKGGLFNEKEEPDIKKLLKKDGWDDKDKEKLY